MCYFCFVICRLPCKVILFMKKMLILIFKKKFLEVWQLCKFDYFWIVTKIWKLSTICWILPSWPFYGFHFSTICLFPLQKASLFTVLFFAVLTIHIKFLWNLTPVSCSKPGIATYSRFCHSYSNIFGTNPRE